MTARVVRRAPVSGAHEITEMNERADRWTSRGTSGRPQLAHPRSPVLSGTDVAMLLAMMYSAPLVFAPIYMFSTAGSSAWISGLISGVIGVGVVYLWTKLSAEFPGQTLPKIVEQIAGPWIGWLVNVIFTAYFLLECGVSARMIGEVMLQILPETPLLVLMATALVAGAVAARLGPQTLARMATVHVGVGSISFLITLVALAPLIELRNIFPVLVDGWAPVIQGASPPVALLSHVALIALLLPLTYSPATQPVKPPHGAAQRDNTTRDPDYFRRGLWAGVAGMGFAWAAFYLMLVLEQGIFSAEEASRLAIPALSVARAIDVGVFFERVEVLLIAIWLPAVLIKMCLFIYSTATMIDHLAGTQESWGHYVVPLAAVSLPLAYTLAVDLPTLVRLINGAWAALAIIIKVILPLVILGVHLVQRRVSRAGRSHMA